MKKQEAEWNTTQGILHAQVDDGKRLEKESLENKKHAEEILKNRTNELKDLEEDLKKSEPENAKQVHKTEQVIYIDSKKEGVLKKKLLDTQKDEANAKTEKETQCLQESEE